MAWSSIELPDADVSIAADWLQAVQADALFADLRQTIPWDVHRIRLFGRQVDSPRLSCWIGDAEATYTYSGTRFEPHPWPEALLPIRDRLVDEIGIDFNSVLANLYRDGGDCMGWHGDNEAALGLRPVIASLSLGAVRRFVFKRRNGEQEPNPLTPPDQPRGRVFEPHLPQRGEGQSTASNDGKLALQLPHGSLLLMRGDTQRNYKHALPRTSKRVDARINLTFRRIVAA